MTTQNLPWEDAILQALRGEGGPLHYKDIAHRIIANGLRTATATPENTVASVLSARMLRAGQVEKMERGVWRIPSSTSIPVSQEVIAQAEEESRLVSVAAYGLYWDRDKVNWQPGRRRQTKLLGSPDDSTIEIDFAEQIGIYILYNHLQIMYVGRTTDALLSRLRDHNSAGRRTARWDQFSWFGFRKVNEDGNLSKETENFSTSMLITILESVMIEALIPPLNDKGGELLGTLYRQIEDSELISCREDKFRDMVAQAIRPR